MSLPYIYLASSSALLRLIHTSFLFCLYFILPLVRPLSVTFNLLLFSAPSVFLFFLFLLSCTNTSLWFSPQTHHAGVFVYQLSAGPRGCLEHWMEGWEEERGDFLVGCNLMKHPDTPMCLSPPPERTGKKEYTEIAYKWVEESEIENEFVTRKSWLQKGLNRLIYSMCSPHVTAPNTGRGMTLHMISLLGKNGFTPSKMLRLI